MYDARQFTMAEIATSFGVTPMTIYRHIPHGPTTDADRRTINTNLNTLNTKG
jgi:predicted transcriptional regulator